MWAIVIHEFRVKTHDSWVIGVGDREEGSYFVVNTLSVLARLRVDIAHFVFNVVHLSFSTRNQIRVLDPISFSPVSQLLFRCIIAHCVFKRLKKIEKFVKFQFSTPLL